MVPNPPSTTESATGSPWRNRAFRLLWGGQSTSILGDRVTGIALPWLLVSQTHSAFDAALVLAARYLPLVLLGLPAGVMVDQLDRRGLMVAMDVLRAVVLGAIAWAGIAGLAVPLWSLVLVVLALGSGQIIFYTAYHAWLPDLVGEEMLVHAHAALEASDAAATLAGPTIGGVLIQFLGPVRALGADAISYLISAATLVAGSREDVAPPREPGVSTASRWREALAGFDLILHSRPQRLVRTMTIPLLLTSGAIEVLLAALCKLTLNLNGLQGGIVFGAAGVGGLLASAIAPRIFQSRWQEGLVLALLAATVGCVALALIPLLGPDAGFPLAAVANFVLDGAVSLGFILGPTMGTLLAAPEVRGRVNAAAQMYGAVARGTSVLVLGGLTAQAGVSAAFGVLAGGFVLAAGLGRAFPVRAS